MDCEFGLNRYVTKFLLLGVNWGISILFQGGRYIVKYDLKFNLDLEFYCSLSDNVFFLVTNLLS
jgi:hypothetical protein